MTDRQNVLFAIKITNMMINNETVKRQEISIKIVMAVKMSKLASLVLIAIFKILSD